MTPLKLVAALGVCLAVLTPDPASSQGCATPLPASAGMRPTRLTPVTLRILQTSLTPVPATDGFIHLAYAAQLTNLNPKPAMLVEIGPVDPLRGFDPTGESSVLDMNGKDITGTVRPFKPPLLDGVESVKPTDTTELPGGGSGISFFDVRYTTMDSVPRLLSSRLLVTFLGSPEKLTEYTDPVPVDCRPPVVISPPLVGPRWWNANGCCEVISPHRAAILPINGDLTPPEQFAIDYVQLTPGDGCCSGPVQKLSSWPFFGAPILAAADGTVVDRVDGMPEQVPGEVKDVTAQNATGNSIIEDIGDGRYILYAHIKTGTIPKRIVIGAKLTRAEQIGEIGNSGSSTAPHLHFQVMDRPSALNSTGLPFVFDRQVLEGRIMGTANQVNDAYEAGDAVRFVKRDAPLTQLDLMPAEGQVFGYNLP